MAKVDRMTGRPVRTNGVAPDLEGYCVELAEKISKLLNIDFEMTLPSDQTNTYGQKAIDGQWSGLMGEVIIPLRFDIGLQGLLVLSCLIMSTFVFRRPGQG